MSVIVVRDLVKTFRKVVGRRWLLLPLHRPVEALRGISFRVEEGEIVGLLGPNGAGKTTTVRILLGILHPTSGYVRVFGKDPTREREEIIRRTGAVFGNKYFLEMNLTAYDAVRIQSLYFDVPKEEFEERFWRLAKMLRVEELAYKRLRHMSLGERRKFELIAALIHDPELLILDEPTIGLDFPSKRAVRTLVKEAGKTVLFTSHDALDIEEVCQRVIILREGRIVADTRVEELKRGMGIKMVKIITEGRPEEVPEGWRYERGAVVGRIKSWQELTPILRELERYGIVDVEITYPSIEEILSRLYG